MSSNTEHRVAKRYRVRKTLGSGGVGVVYEATDSVLNKTVALKMLHDSMSQSDLMRFQREARAAARLEHPSIVKVLDFGVDSDETAFLAMEFIEGESLKDVLDSGRDLSVEEKLTIFKQIAGAMRHAHMKGVLHRDLKPANTLLSGRPEQIRAHVVDFGLAKQIVDQNVTATGAMVGSPPYVSPEQVRGERVDQRADIYSFGCMMFELFTGKPPLKGANSLETIEHQLSTAPPSVLDKVDVSACPEGAALIIDHCLIKELDERIESFDRIVEMLEASQMPEKVDLSVLRAAEKQRLRLSFVVPVMIVALIVFFILKNLSVTGQDIQVAKSSQANQQLKDPSNGSKTYEIKGDVLKARKGVTDEDLKGENLSAIRKVDFVQTEVTGSFLQYLNRSRVRVLNLNGTRFKNEFVPLIAEMRSLTLLNLRGTDITTKDLRRLATLDRLWTLDVGDNANMDAGAARVIVEQWPDLRDLIVVGTSMKGEALKTISRLTKLRSLVISDNMLRDRDVLQVELPVVNEIHASRSFFTDRGLLHFASMPTLRNLYIRGCKNVTPDGIGQFNKKLPDCKVHTEEHFHYTDGLDLLDKSYDVKLK